MTWLGFGEPLGFRCDSLAVHMMAIVLIISALVHVYSIEYMRNHARRVLYFAYLSFFTLAMLGLVASDNFLFFFIFWELMGLASYLLIGFYYEYAAANRAAMKAFLVTRVGDVALLIGIASYYAENGTFLMAPVAPSAFCATMLLIGAIGKSAQFPLHFWLPDAMEGPSPVSALIHAATMVAAGIYLVGRAIMIGLFPPEILMLTLIVGAITAFMGAVLALATWDIKKVLAYSTISQLGFMMAALGMNNTQAAFGHLFTHAFFKALLFLGAGAILHAIHTRDMREMGGLRKTMPWTYATMVIAGLSLAGFPFTAGFASKDLILEAASDHSVFVYILLLVTSIYTSWYVVRLLLVVFHGEAKAPAVEVPWTMKAPMIALAFGAIFAGANLPHADFRVIGWSVIAMLAGARIAFRLRDSVFRIPPIADTIYNAVGGDARRFAGWCATFDRRALDRALDATAPMLRLTARLSGRFDDRGIDRAVNGIGDVARDSGTRVRRIQTGRIQDYALAAMIGVLLLALVI